MHRTFSVSLHPSSSATHLRYGLAVCCASGILSGFSGYQAAVVSVSPLSIDKDNASHAVGPRRVLSKGVPRIIVTVARQRQQCPHAQSLQGSFRDSACFLNMPLFHPRTPHCMFAQGSSTEARLSRAPVLGLWNFESLPWQIRADPRPAYITRPPRLSLLMRSVSLRSL